MNVQNELDYISTGDVPLQIVYYNIPHYTDSTGCPNKSGKFKFSTKRFLPFLVTK